MVAIFLPLAACSGPESPSAPTTIAEVGATELDYLVTVDEAPFVTVSGGEFEITTNNCGARASALETFTRSRSFDVTLNTEFSETLKGKLGGDVIVAGAELEVAVGLKLGVQIGSTETVQTERQIETPPDSITTVTLHWEEIWQTGTVTLRNPDQSELGQTSFRVLTTLRLTQTGIEETICGTLAPGNGGAVDTNGEQAIPEQPEPPENEPPPTETSTPAPTATMAPSPTPSNTPLPPPTNTPVGMLNEIHMVDAYRTALGNSYNTGIYVQPGDSVAISYLNGEWWIGQSSNSSCNGYGDPQTPTDAAGYTDRDGERVEALIVCSNPNMCRPLTTASWGSLLGSIGENGALFHIGDQLDFSPQESGILYLRINYFNHNAVTGCPYGDGGEITVRVRVTPQN